MAGASIEINSTDLRRWLQRAADSARNMLPAWQQVGEHMLRSTDKNFDAEGRPDRWKPLSRQTWISRAGGRRKSFTKRGKTSARLRRTVDRGKILTRSARFRRSVTYAATNRGVKWGSNLIYAAIQHFGGKAGRGKKVTIPARPVFVLLRQDMKSIARIIKWHIFHEGLR